MEKQIKHLRRELSILSEFEQGTNVKRKMCRKLKRKYRFNKENITMKEKVKQRMQLKAQKMQRYDKRGKCYPQDLIFKNDTKEF